MQFFQLQKKEEKKENEEGKKKEEEKPEEKEEEKKQEEAPADVDLDVRPLLAPHRKVQKNLFSEAARRELDQIRRWKVKISNIHIENLYSEVYSPFIEFVIGGDEHEIMKKDKKGQPVTLRLGEPGIMAKTEVLELLELQASRDFSTVITSEYHGSYFDIMEQNLRMDIWDMERWGINAFYSRQELPLLDIANGEVMQNLTFQRRVGKKRTNLCRLSFAIIFQEIWDFQISVTDWSVSELLPADVARGVNSFLKLKLLARPDSSTITSSDIRDERNPVWPSLPGQFTYRGSISDLESINIEISIRKPSFLFSSEMGSKTVSLRGVSHSGTIKTTMSINSKFLKGNPHDCTIRGRFQIMKRSKYQQSGEVVVLRSDEQYVCVNIMRVDNVVLAQDRGIVNSFVTVEWGGQIKQTRTIFNSYSPAFNENCYFPIVVSEAKKNSKKAYVEAVQKELVTFSTLKFNLWEVGMDDGRNNLGSTTYFFDSLADGKPDTKDYYDERTEQILHQKQRIWSGKQDLTTPFVSGSGASHLYFEVYVLFEHENELAYDGLKENYEDKLPDRPWDQLDKLWALDEQLIQGAFPDETRRKFTTKQHDEYNREHLLPLYLIKMQYPKRVAIIKTGNEQDQVETVSYLPVEKPTQFAYFVSSIAFDPRGAADIWASPDFLIAMGKGEIEEHALLLANLLMGSEDGDVNTSTRKKVSAAPPIANRVFVCVGTLKETQQEHVWVMVIEKNCKDVTFWEPSTGQSKLLERRVEQIKELTEFLARPIIETKKKSTRRQKGETTTTGKTKKKVQEESDSEFDEDDYEEEDPNVGIEAAAKPEDVFVNTEDIDDQYRRLDWRNVGKPTKPKDPNQPQSTEEVKKPTNFVSKLEKRDEEEQKKETQLWAHPRVFSGSADVLLPYRTIEVVFNNTNIFMNRQHYDPAKILYDLHNPLLWKEYITGGWNTPLVSFYTPRSFDTPIPELRAADIQIKIIREIRLGISAFRSGKNLGTSWMAQSHDIVGIMNTHLLFLEEVARGTYSPEDQKATKEKFRSELKQRMPPDCKFSALPARFTFIDQDRVRQVLLVEGGDFFQINTKQLKFALAVKLFPYAGGVNSLRVMVGTFQVSSDALKYAGVKT